jgi:hypothetical protein
MVDCQKYIHHRCGDTDVVAERGASLRAFVIDISGTASEGCIVKFPIYYADVT